MKKGSQVQIVMDYLHRYGTLTSLQAFKNWSITRLASVIEDLRRAGWDIETELIERNGTRYAKYHFMRGDR